MDDNSPATLTPQIEQPWGRLVSCLPALDSINLYTDSFKIGRSPVCDVVVDDSVIRFNGINSNIISKEHFLLKKSPDNTVYLTDLSKNGTLINGKKFERGHEVVLKDNDKIAVGKEKWNIYIFKDLSAVELPDTLSTSDPLTSSSLTPRIHLPAWGRLMSCLLHIKSFDLYGPQFKVGRAPHCDAVIDEMDIDSKTKSLFSKEHFVIDKDPNDPVTFITDLSKTGTYLNGRLIGKNRRNILQNDDSISVGPRKKSVYVYKSMESSAAHYLPEALRNKYEPCTLLGKGGCGEVRLAYKKRTCKKYAIKNIMKGRSSQLNQLNHPSKIQTEINILKSLSHPFVIRMEDIVETDEEVFLVLEYMPGGELNDRILSSTIPLTEPTAKFLFYQMVLAVQFLHSNGITHRDLKPENVLLVSDDVETQLKVSDFGLSKVTEGDDMMRTICGTLRYIAPEVLSFSVPEYDCQVDIWSLGVILFYMLAKRPPFDSPDKAIITKLIKCGAYSTDDSWDKVSPLAKDLVRRMLTVDPRQRITIDGILQHPWISDDTNMQKRVHSLLDASEEISDCSSDMEPAKKRVRLSSDESME